MILPPGPITAPMNSLSITIISTRGVCGFNSAAGCVMALSISPRMCKRPSLAWLSAFSTISHFNPLFLNADGCAGARLNVLNDLTTRAYYRTNEFLINNDHFNTWCMWLQLRCRLRNGFVHFSQNVQATFSGLAQRFFYHFPLQSVDLKC